MGHSAVHEHLQTLRRRYKVKKRKAPPSQPTCSSGALRSVGCFGCDNSRLSSVIAQKQMCAKYRTLPYSAKELSALSGLAPRIIESGSSVHSSYLSRRSSGRLRQILYLDSVPGVPKIPVLQEFHQRLIGKGKKKMTARCACMRKMLLILRSMVVHNTPFNGKFPNNQRRGLDF